MAHIFISYSRKNSDCVYEVAEEMKKQDFPLWIDLESIPITSEWLERIEQAIKSARVFMLFWSADAAKSDYVQHELKIAKRLAVERKIQVLVVMLDETPIPLDHIQAYDMKSGCSNIAVKTLVNNLPKEWKQFSKSKTLGEQTHTVVEGEYVAVSWDYNPLCHAYIMGKRDARLATAPEHLVVALQFTGPTSNDMRATVMNSLPSENAVILHVTGPTANSRYELDNYNLEQWRIAREFIIDSIQGIGNAPKTILHFCTLTPNALMGAVTVNFYRFWHLKLYNYVDGKYVLVMDIPRT